jgi:tRNA(Ile)-lysidine synthase
MEDVGDPIRPEELEALFAPFARWSSCALAVSGGSDSTALMALFADWLRLKGLDGAGHAVVTVDHGLRADSADEARSVARTAIALGLPHRTLVWQGPRPRSGIQAVARSARYRLIGDYLCARGIALLLTAHTREDQAETLLMRLARGSGLDGLSAMSPLSPLPGRPAAGAEAAAGSLWIGRPFLDVPKARLRATLEARGIAWIEDPSNAAPEFERTRLRAAQRQLAALGLTPAMLALSAARLARVRRAVDGLVDRICNPATGVVRIDPWGVIGIDRAKLLEAGEEIALRVLERAVAAAGGAAEPVPLGKLEPIAAAICREDCAAVRRWTLARALLTAGGSEVLVEREPARVPLPELTLMPGDTALWDGRFQVCVAPTFAGGPVQVRALGEANVRDLRSRGAIAKDAPLRAAALVPSFWLDGSLVAVPSLAYRVGPLAEGGLETTFPGSGLRGSGKDPFRPAS